MKKTTKASRDEMRQYIADGHVAQQPCADVIDLLDDLDSLASELERAREDLRRAHSCATLRDDGTCDGCFVSEALSEERKDT